MTGLADTDIAIVGAGVAGLAAAKRIRAAGRSVRVLEARDRIGGRALTDTDSLGVAWDRGCHWLHSADTNPFTAIADALGFTYKTTVTPRRLWLGDRWAADAELAELDAVVAERFGAVTEAGRAGRDVAAADVLPRDDTWAPLVAQWLAALSGADPDRLSTLDDARYADSPANWPVGEGYGALVAAWGRDVPVARGTPVTALDWRAADHVRLATPAGDLRARQVIVTVPTSVLAAGGIAFTPDLPPAHAEALAAVPLGGANKVAIRFDRDVFGTGMCHMTSQPHAPEGMSFQLRPFGRDLAIGYLGGRYAAEMEAAGPEAMAARALDILSDAFGGTVRRHVAGWATTGWSLDPLSRGGYSIALPGEAAKRPVLTAPIGDRVRLAGEACSLDAFGTANGAHASGEAAAAAALAALTARPPV